MRLTPAQLEAIVRVAEHGSFTRAAETLHLTQPALSHRVAEAERLLGALLFNRSRRHISITSTGEEVVEAARRALGAFERGVDRVHSAAENSPPAVHVAALPSLAAVVLPPALRDLDRPSARAHYTVTAAHAGDVLSLVVHGTCDLGLTTLRSTPAPASAQDVWSRVLHEDEFVALLPPAHSLASRHDAVAWPALVKERFIMPPLSSSLHYALVETFRSTRHAPSDTLAGGEITVMAGLVAAGLGVAVMPRLALPLTRFVDLEIRKIEGARITRLIHCIGARDSKIEPASALLLDAVRTALART